MIRPEKARTLEELYAMVPEVGCVGKCAGSCGPVPVTRDEIVAMERRSICRFGVRADGVCTMLAAGRCAVYDVRPLLCRLWGALERMSCPWGCKPRAYLSEAEAEQLLRAAARLGGGFDGDRLLEMMRTWRR